jgi:predicted transcriptional regulator
MMKTKETVRPTEGELEILSVLWERGSATVREVHEAISAERPMVYTGVLKLMQIMADKGLVSGTRAPARMCIAPRWRRTRRSGVLCAI